MIQQRDATRAGSKRPGAAVLFHNIVGAEVAPAVWLDRRRRRLSGVVKRHAPKMRPYIVSVHRRGQLLRPTDDTVRMRKTWAQTLIGAEDVVVVTYLPLGGGAGNSQAKQIGGAVALAALAIALPYAIPALAAGTALAATFAAGSFATVAASAGIVLGAGYLVSRLTKPKASPTDESGRPVYGVSGGGNLPRPGDRIPSSYGRCWTQPDLSQPDYSIFDGEDQLLYKRQTLGLGKYQVHNIHLGTAPLWNEDDGVLEPFAGALGGSGAGELGVGIGGGVSASSGGTEVEIVDPGATSALVPASVYSQPSVSAIEMPRASDSPTFAGPFLAQPLGTETARIQVDFSLPLGCIGVVKSSGADFAQSYGVVFEYAPCDEAGLPTGGYVTLLADTGTLKTKRAQRFSRFVDVPLGSYLVRAYNLVDWLDPFNHDNDNASFEVVNTVMWDGLRAHFAETIVRPLVTEIALKIRSGKSLGVTAFGDLWVEATRILPVWTGSAWEDQPTRKAVYAFKDIMQADYGGSLPDGQVDLDRIKFYADELSEHDTFDGVIRGPVSVWEAAATVLGPMRSEPARIANTWSINRDEPRAVQKHHITRRQIVRNTTAASFKIARDDGAADVIAEYAPEGDPRRRRDLRVTFGTPSLTPSRVQLAGVTSHDHAHHLATWKAASAYLRRERRKVTLDRRGRIISRGDPARIDAWFMTDARAAGILARDGLELTLDTPVVVGGSTYTTLRDRMNREWGPVKVTAPSGVDNVIILDADDVAAVETSLDTTLDEAISADDQEMTSLLVGTLTELQDGYLIDSVQPQGRDRVAIEAMFDHPGVWDALGEAIPPPPPIPSIADIVENAVPTVPWLRARCVQKAVSLEMEWAVGTARGAASYVVQLSYDAGEVWEQVSNSLSTSGTYALRHIDGIDVKVAAFAVSRFGVPGPAVYFEFTTFKPIISGDIADIEIRINELSGELDARVRQVVDQLPALIQQVHDDVDQTTKALNSHVSSLRELIGRVTQGVGVRYGQNSALITEARVLISNAEESIAAISTLLETTYATTSSVNSSVATAKAEAVSIAASNATSAIAAFAATLDATYATDSSVATAKAEAISIAASNATSAIAAFSATLDATYATDVSVSTAQATAISTAASNADSAIAAFAATLDATYATDSSVTTAQATAISTAASNADSAIAAFAATLDATYATDSSVATAHADAISVATANASSALAAFVASFLATSGAGTASGFIRFIAASAPSGVVASFAVEVNVGSAGSPNWQASGIYLDAMVGFSRIRLVADLIELSHPDLNDEEPFPMFSISSIDGVNRAVFNAELYVQKLIADAIQTKHIAAGNIQIPSFNSSTTPVNFTTTTETSVLTCSVTFTGVAGSDVLVLMDGSFEVQPQGDTICVATFRVDMESTDVDGGYVAFAVPNDVPFRTALNGGVTVEATGSSQTVTATLYVTKPSGRPDFDVLDRKLKVQAFLR